MLLDVVAVKALPNYQLDLTFENGEQRRFDMNRLMDLKPFNRLKDNSFFGAHIAYGTVVWPGTIDIAPETLYADSVPLPPS
jgi:hypothetical protein